MAFNLDRKESSRITFVRDISKRGKGALLLVKSLSNVNLKKIISCFSKQLIKTLIDYGTSGSVPSPSVLSCALLLVFSGLK